MNEYIGKVYKSYDRYINNIYKIDINEKVLERIKKHFNEIKYKFQKF